MRRLLTILAAAAAAWPARFAWRVLARGLAADYRRTSLDILQLEGAIGYVKAVRSARRAFLGGLAAVAAVGLLTAGFVLLHVGLFVLLFQAWERNWTALALAILALGAIYVTGPLLVIRFLAADKTWMRLFRADTLVARLTRRS